MTKPSSKERVVKAAMRWYRAAKPLSWTQEQQDAHPQVNQMTNVDCALAIACAVLARAKKERK